MSAATQLRAPARRWMVVSRPLMTLMGLAMGGLAHDAQEASMRAALVVGSLLAIGFGVELRQVAGAGRARRDDPGQAGAA